MTFKEFLFSWSLFRVNQNRFLSPYMGLNPARIIRSLSYKLNQYLLNPNYFNPFGTTIFCGDQGDGKTLTAAAVYCKQLLNQYPYAILCTNTKFRNRPFNAYVCKLDYSDEQLHLMYDEVKETRRHEFFQAACDELKSDFYQIKYPEFTLQEYVAKMLPTYIFDENDDFESFAQSKMYQLRDIFTDQEITTEKIVDGTFKNVTVQYWGIDSLKYINNGQNGVLFFIDEIHLELNSLESKNIPIEVFIELSQQRKQRKHIVGTSQVYMRMAKPLREQMRNVILCHCLLGVIQHNKLIDGTQIEETSSGVKCKCKRNMLWFHSPVEYEYYDTYVKQKRYNNEWTGRPQILDIYNLNNNYKE